MRSHQKSLWVPEKRYLTTGEHMYDGIINIHK